jgi:hypothetical protein
MMDDRTLLELAAKAAGKRIHVWGTLGSENVADMDGPTGNRWNPLTDDGDALRLAVILGLDKKLPFLLEGESYRADRFALGVFAATRRAIVRAAAAIGKEM